MRPAASSNRPEHPLNIQRLTFLKQTPSIVCHPQSEINEAARHTADPSTSLRSGRDDKGRVVTSRKVSDLDGHSYERLLCEDHRSTSLRFGRDDKGRVVSSRKVSELDGQSYEQLLCEDHRSLHFASVGMTRGGWLLPGRTATWMAELRTATLRDLRIPPFDWWQSKKAAVAYISSSTKARATSGGMR